MLHQLGWRLDTDTARGSPQAVTDFLVQNRSLLSALTVREAAKHLNLP